MATNNQSEYVVSGANLESLKIDIANRVGLGNQVGVSPVTANNYEEVVDLHKDQISQQLGILPRVEQVGWENISSRDCGKIGGRIGGHVGGQMVREMIQRAESILAGRQ